MSELSDTSRLAADARAKDPANVNAPEKELALLRTSQRSRGFGRLFAPLVLGLTAVVASGLAPVTTSAANAQTRFEQALAAAAGRAAGRVASHLAANATLIGAERAKTPACRAGARELGLRGFRRLEFIVGCRRIL